MRLHGLANRLAAKRTSEVEPAKGDQKPAEEPKAAAPAAKAQAEKRDWWEAPDVSKMDDPWSRGAHARMHATFQCARADRSSTSILLGVRRCMKTQEFQAE